MGCCGWLGNKLRKLNLLLWKNFVIETRRPIVLVMELVLPLIIPIVLIIVRSTIDVTQYDHPTYYQKLPLSLSDAIMASGSPEGQPAFAEVNSFADMDPLSQYLSGHEDTNFLIRQLFHLPMGQNISCPNMDLAFAPDNNPQAEKLIQGMKQRLPCLIHKVTPFRDEETLVKNLTEEGAKDTYLCGLVFEETDTSTTSYKIRFPFMLRFSEEIGDWKTDHIFPYVLPQGPRNPMLGKSHYNITREFPDFHKMFPDLPETWSVNSFGGLPSYFLEGFLFVQQALDLAIMESVGMDTSELTFEVQRMPYPPYLDDTFVGVLEGFLAMLFLLCFIFMTFNIVKNLVVEKEKRLKESMKIMGLENYLHWTAWFIQYFILTFLVVCLTTLLMCTKMSKYKVLPNSDWSVIFVFLLLYGLSSMLLCFMLSTFFSKANAAAVIATLIWFLTYLPWLLINTRYDELSASSKLMGSVFCNTGMGLGAYIISQYESSGVGAQWDNIGSPVDMDDNVSLSQVLGVLLFDSVLYALLTWYIEAVFPGDFGYPQKFYFFLQPSYWFGSSEVETRKTDAEPDCAVDFLEEEPVGIEKGIEIKGFRKVFNKTKVAVNNLNLNLFHDQITVLLGHNGAGKSTTMSMLTGLFPPTSGNAIVNGFKVNGQLGQVRESLGLCPQHDVLFDLLTVEEHLQFFGSLKGAPQSKLKFEIPKLLEELELENKIRALSKMLSGGMKRKLSVAIALIGESKIVILDEPTSGMDPAARRLTWDVLLGNKANRTIMLTTHFMDEADVLGDRIAIMADGRLQCVGSSLFLKNKYGVGYQLSIVKGNDCNVSSLEKAVTSFVPGAYIERHVGSELLFTLPSQMLKQFYNLFMEMEMKQEELGIEAYGVSVTTIEEVFLRVGKLYEDEAPPALERHFSVSSNAVNSVHEADELQMSMNSSAAIDFKHNDGGTEDKNERENLWLQQFYAMLVKRVIHSVRNKKLGIAQVFIPALCVVAALIVTKIAPSALQATSLTMNLKDYRTTVTYVSGNQSNALFSEAIEQYSNLVRQSWYKKSSVQYVDDIEEAIVKGAEHSLGDYNTKIMVGASFQGENKVKAWFNNQALHTASLAINLITNALILASGFNHTVQTANYPLTATLEDASQSIQNGSAIWQGFNIATNVAFGFAFLVASFVVFPVKERATKSKHLQYVSGLQPSIFWLSAFAWDFVNFIASCVVLIILFAIFNVGAYSGDRLLYLSVIFCEYSLAALPLMYSCSFMFKDSTSAFVRCTTINILLSIATMLTVVILKAPGIDEVDVSNTLAWVFLLLVPQYCLPISLVDLYINYEAHDNCAQRDLSYEECEKYFPGQITESYFAWERPGVSRYCVFYLLHSVVWWTVLACIESNLVLLISNKVSRWRSHLFGYDYVTMNNSADDVNQENGYQNHRRAGEEHLDADVQSEVEYVKKNSQRVKQEKTLVVEGLSKTYFVGDCLNPTGMMQKVDAVRQMYLTVSPGECFGLLGVNGAGKTTTFKMLTGDIAMSDGTAFIKGLDISSNIKKAQQRMGYCPQFDALIDQMTGRETLRMFARLRGLRKSTIEDCIEELLQLLDISKHADKQTREYSGGNKRKLSTAIAMIGLPPLVFLDEPTTGMDPAARRSLWKVILHLVKKCSLSVILTSHSMEECEYLCSRLAIMVNGRFQCLGAPQHLKNRFGKGFTLIAKLEYDRNNEVKQAFHHFVTRTFPNSILKDEHQTMVQYQVMNPDLKWSQIFKTLEDNKAKLRMVDYSVSQTSLEQVFLNFARNQTQ